MSTVSQRRFIPFITSTLHALAERLERPFRQDVDSFLGHVKGVIHVGANLGQERKRYASYGLNVLWIEPIPEIFDRLAVLIAPYAKQKAVQYLVADADDRQCSLHVSSNEGGSSSILDLALHKKLYPGVGYTRTITLRTTTLSSVAKRENLDMADYDALVLDTQGSELLVLRGAADILPHIQYVQTEAADFESYAGCCRLGEIDRFLRTHGFRRLLTKKLDHKPGVGTCYEVVHGRRGVPRGNLLAAKELVPRTLRRRAKTLRRRWRLRPPSRRVRLGGLRRTTPISRSFGFDRGLPIDRHYIEGFLGRHAADVRGRVLEIGDATYTRRFGGSQVTQSDVLHVVPGSPAATLIGDLATGAGVPQDAFDCVILTQTLPFIYDARSAIGNVYAALKPGGVVLATVPGISQISRYDADRWGDFWRFTPQSARQMFRETFAEDAVTIESHGNVLAAVAILHGLAAEELRPGELAYNDPDYPVTITIRAQKGSSA